MKFKRLFVVCAVVIAGGASYAVDAAQARHKTGLHKVHKARIRCADHPYRFSLQRFLFGEKPQPNGCAPPVFVDGEYIGQDPDLNIRFQLYRDPDTGYTSRY